jgi:CubicO group peptidase (beta-lactamase class C family)
MQVNPARSILAALMLSACHSTTVLEPATSFAQFEDNLESLRVSSHISAISVAIARDQSIVYSRGFGIADIGENRPATDATVYQLASLTKPFASVVIMQLVEEGLVSLDDPVSKYGINLQSSGIVRVRHLLSHTSEGTPGASYSYNGNRFSLLDSVIAHATGQTFAQAVEARVISRIGLANTAPVFQNNMARGYTWKDGQQVFTPYPSTFSTAAGLTASALDYARFSMAMDRDALLAPATKALAYAPTVLTSGEISPYGLGWFSTEYKGVRIIWHYGYWTANSSLVIKVPSRRLTYVVLSNSDQLSAPYPLGAGKLEQSPWATAFLDAFVVGSVPLPNGN